MKKTVKIDSVIEAMGRDWNTHKATFDITVQPIEEGGQAFTLSGDYFKRYMLNKYSEWVYFVRGENYISEFKQLFTDFKELNARGIQRVWETLQNEYNPLHNYDRTEKHETTFEGKETNTNTKSGNITDDTTFTGTEKEETTFSGEEERSTDYGATLEASSRVAYDSNSLLPNESTTEAMKNDTTTTSYNDRKDSVEKSFNDRTDNKTTTYNDVTDEAVKEFENRKDTEEIRAFGNIGTTKSSEMAIDEIMLRTQNAFYKIVYDWFVKENTFLM